MRIKLNIILKKNRFEVHTDVTNLVDKIMTFSAEGRKFMTKFERQIHTFFGNFEGRSTMMCLVAYS